MGKMFAGDGYVGVTAAEPRDSRGPLIAITLWESGEIEIKTALGTDDVLSFLRRVAEVVEDGREAFDAELAEVKRMWGNNAEH